MIGGYDMFILAYTKNNFFTFTLVNSSFLDVNGTYKNVVIPRNRHM